MSNPNDLSIKITAGSRNYTVHISNLELPANNVSIEIKLPDETGNQPAEPNPILRLFQNMLVSENPSAFVQQIVPITAPVQNQVTDEITQEDYTPETHQDNSTPEIPQEEHLDESDYYENESDEESEDVKYKQQLQQSIITSMVSPNNYEEQSTKNYWDADGNLSDHYHTTLRFGQINRPSLSFAALIRHHPKYDQITQQLESLEMYREIFIVFDEWIRNAMHAEQFNNHTLGILKCCDIMFGKHLLKFPKLIPDTFNEFLSIFDKRDVPYNGQNADKLKNILALIKDGALDDIIDML